jgi:hypothetical protein
MVVGRSGPARPCGDARVGLLLVALLGMAGCGQRSTSTLPDGLIPPRDAPGQPDGPGYDVPVDTGTAHHDAGDGPSTGDGPPDVPSPPDHPGPPADAGPPLDASAGADADAGPWSRDYSLHPAVVRRGGVTRLWGVSDVHGDRDRLVTLLAAGGLVSGEGTSPTWTGGTDLLVVNGDSIDKGPQSIEVLDYWMALMPLARASGGEVIVLAGNHEIELLADPTNHKATALQDELGSETPEMFVSTDDLHGRFLHELPIAALVDGWFFSHAGNSQGLSLDEIGATYMQLVDGEQWSDPFLVDSNSIIEARNWWPTHGTRDFLDGYLQALPASHFVFGHHPTSFANPPTGNIEVHSQGRLVLIDVGMSRAVNYSTGKLLRVDDPGTPAERAAMVTPSGGAVALDLMR